MKKIKQIKGIEVLFGLIMTTLLFGFSGSSFGQTNDNDYAEIYIYRAKQGMMSGSNSLEVKVKMNDKEIGALSNGTKLKYKIYSEGSIKIKCIGEFGGGAVGKPYVTTIDIENGKEYHIALTVSSIKGVSGEILNEKKLKKMGKEKFFDEIELEEDKSDPLIGEDK